MTELGLQYGKNLRSDLSQRPGGVSIPEKHSEPCFGRQGLFKASAVPEIALTIREWKAFCDLEEGKDLQDLRVQADSGSGEEHCFQVHIRVLQPNPHILGQSRRTFAGCIPRMGESKRADGSLTAPRRT